jgi:cytochrome b561
MGLAANSKYSGVAMAFHWLVGIAVIASWLITQAAEDAPNRDARSEIMANHFALGVVIFVLVAARLIWRLASPPPAPSPHHAGWERALARITHFAMYALLLVMPLAAWFAMSSYGSPISLWGLFDVPVLPVAENPDVAKQIFGIHALAGTTLLVLIALHVAAAFKHTLVDRDGTIFKMLPFGTVRN